MDSINIECLQPLVIPITPMVLADLPDAIIVAGQSCLNREKWWDSIRVDLGQAENFVRDMFGDQACMEPTAIHESWTKLCAILDAHESRFGKGSHLKWRTHSGLVLNRKVRFVEVIQYGDSGTIEIHLLRRWVYRLVGIIYFCLS